MNQNLEPSVLPSQHTSCTSSRMEAVAQRALRQSILNKTNGVCYYCGKDIRLKWVMDHFLAKALGGSDEHINLVPACWRCNSSKHSLTIEDFRIRFALNVSFNERQMEFLEEVGVDQIVRDYANAKISKTKFWFEKAPKSTAPTEVIEAQLQALRSSVP